MPGVLQYQSTLNANRNTNPPTNSTPVNTKDTELWFPSSLPAAHRACMCVNGLPAIEEKLCTTQCHDALNGIRHILKMKSRMIHFKNRNIRGQRDGTRSRAVIDQVHVKARTMADKYRAARHAKLALTGPGKWETTLCVLEDADIRSYQDLNKLHPKRGRKGVLEDDQVLALKDADHTNSNGDVEMEDLTLFNEVHGRRDGTGETQRTLLWIWLSGVRTPEKDDDTDDILRAEWVKSRVRAKRSKEEVMLLKEKMHHVLEYLSWKSKWWRERANLRTVDPDLQLSEGLTAYSAMQADLLDRLSTCFKILWKVPLQSTNQESNTGAAGGSTPPGTVGQGHNTANLTSTSSTSPNAATRSYIVPELVGSPRIDDDYDDNDDNDDYDYDDTDDEDVERELADEVYDPDESDEDV